MPKTIGDVFSEEESEGEEDELIGETASKSVGKPVGETVGETVVSDLAKRLFPAIKVALAALVQCLSAVMMIGKAVLSTMGMVLGFLRDVLFEQVEVDD